MMTEIPFLPHSYTSDPHLNSFLKLTFLGLSYDRSLRPTIDKYQEHQFLQVEAGNYYDIDKEEREYAQILESIFSGDEWRWKAVKKEACAKRGYVLPLS